MSILKEIYEYKLHFVNKQKINPQVNIESKIKNDKFKLLPFYKRCNKMIKFQ